MNAARSDRLYSLLPALYRTVDENEGGALRALLAVLQKELDLLEEDMQAQYDNWFIETCDRWVIPYIADLVGVRGLNDPQQISDGQRRRVANAIRYRRRKGTLAVLEHALRDVSDWPVHGRECFRYQAMTQQLDLLRPDTGRTFDARDRQTLAAVGTPFDSSAHTVDLRPIRTNGQVQEDGRYNKKIVGLFLWRLRPYPVVHSPARPVRSEQGPPFRFTFDPMGGDVRLYNKPLPVPDRMHTTTIETLPLPLSRQMLTADLATYAKHPSNERNGNSVFYGPDRGLLIQYADQEDAGQIKRHIVPPEALLSLPLWEELDGLEVPDGKSVAIDVERGRFAFLGLERPKPNVVPVVNYTYGFSDDIGGGPYERTPPLHLDDVEVLHVYVAEGCANESVNDVAERWKDPGPWQAQARTLAHAFAIWDEFYSFRVEHDQGQVFQPTAVIHIVDNGLYGGRNVEAGNDLRVSLGPGSRLSIVAADGVRPSIRTLHNLVISCELSQTTDSVATDRQLQLNGLLIHSQLVVPDAQFAGSLSIDIDHCTLLPGGIAVEVNQPTSQNTQLLIRRSLVGPLKMASVLEQFAVSDSIVDGLGKAAISVDGEFTFGQTILRRVTVLGAVALQSLTYAQDCLFTSPMTLATVHEGDAVRYCYIQELSAPTNELIQENCAWGRLGIKPVFTSTAFGDPAYGQLTLETPTAILQGASNGSSLGVFSRLNEPQRFAGIQPVLDEYLPLGLEAELFFVT